MSTLLCHARYPEYDSERTSVIDVELYDSIDEYVDAWLDVPEQNHISILGDFGSGKSWFCLHYANQIAQRYLAAPEQEKRIPILILLRQYVNAPRIEAMASHLWHGPYLLDENASYQVLRHLNRYGRTLLILDGFDEMNPFVDNETMVSQFTALSRLVEPHSPSKVILSSRTTYFRTDMDMHTLLGDGKTIELRSKPNFHVIYLRALSESQIKAILQKRLPDQWESYHNFIKATYDLPNLAERPVLLDIIISTLPRLYNLEGVTHALLYKVYTDQWIEYNVGEGRTLIGKDDKRLLMQELAWEMYANSKLRMHHSEFPVQIQGHFGFPSSKLVDYLAHDLRAQTFLVRDSAGYFEFAHRSFVEFFVADKLAADIVQKKPDNLSKHPLSPEIADFLKELLQKSAANTLSGWMLSTRDGSFLNHRYLGGNAITLLKAMRCSLINQNLSGTVLVGANLSGADLTGTCFADADLTNVILNGAVLRDVDFSRANLESTRIDDVGSLVCLAVSPLDSRVATGHSDGILTSGVPSRASLEGLQVTLAA